MRNSRRSFLGRAGSALLAAHVMPGCGGGTTDATSGAQDVRGNPLRLPPDLGASFAAARSSQSVWPGSSTALLSFGGSYPSPTLRLVSRQTLALAFRNDLAEPTNVRWHGLAAPPEMDGHPADLVAPGGSRSFAFTVEERPGTYWYHPHPDGSTARQVYSGMAGFILVSGSQEQALGLPSGERDVPLLLQDRRTNADRSFTYAPTTLDVFNGYLGDQVLVNGTPEAYLRVSADLHRFRLLNGSNARVYRLAFSNGLTFHVIGTDGGLLEAPVPATSVDLGPGERLDVLADLAGAAGQSVTLKSLPFQVPSGMGGGMMGGGSSGQGVALDVLRLDVERAAAGTSRLPASLGPIDRLDPARAVVQRDFVLQMGMHGPGAFLINGRRFAADRVDVRVRLGDLEVWNVQNASSEFHPFHVHGAGFQVLSRSRGPLGPQDLGWKDTVLTWPGETVRLAIRFERHRGLYVLHCHNLEHEDAGMKLNVEVV